MAEANPKSQGTSSDDKELSGSSSDVEGIAKVPSEDESSSDVKIESSVGTEAQAATASEELQFRGDKKDQKAIEKNLKESKCFQVWETDYCSSEGEGDVYSDFESDSQVSPDVLGGDTTTRHIRDAIYRSNQLLSSVDIVEKYFGNLEDPDPNVEDEAKMHENFKNMCTNLRQVIDEHLDSTHDLVDPQAAAYSSEDAAMAVMGPRFDPTTAVSDARGAELTSGSAKFVPEASTSRESSLERELMDAGFTSTLGRFVPRGSVSCPTSLRYGTTAGLHTLASSSRSTSARLDTLALASRLASARLHTLTSASRSTRVRLDTLYADSSPASTKDDPNYERDARDAEFVSVVNQFVPRVSASRPTSLRLDLRVTDLPSTSAGIQTATTFSPSLSAEGDSRVLESMGTRIAEMSRSRFAEHRYHIAEGNERDVPKKKKRARKTPQKDDEEKTEKMDETEDSSGSILKEKSGTDSEPSGSKSELKSTESESSKIKIPSIFKGFSRIYNRVPGAFERISKAMDRVPRRITGAFGRIHSRFWSSSERRDSDVVVDPTLSASKPSETDPENEDSSPELEELSTLMSDFKSCLFELKDADFDPRARVDALRARVSEPRPVPAPDASVSAPAAASRTPLAPGCSASDIAGHPAGAVPEGTPAPGAEAPVLGACGPDPDAETPLLGACAPDTVWEDPPFFAAPRSPWFDSLFPRAIQPDPWTADFDPFYPKVDPKADVFHRRSSDYYNRAEDVSPRSVVEWHTCRTDPKDTKKSKRKKQQGVRSRQPDELLRGTDRNEIGDEDYPTDHKSFVRCFECFIGGMTGPTREDYGERVELDRDVAKSRTNVNDFKNLIRPIMAKLSMYIPADPNNPFLDPYMPRPGRYAPWGCMDEFRDMMSPIAAEHGILVRTPEYNPAEAESQKKRFEWHPTTVEKEKQRGIKDDKKVKPDQGPRRSSSMSDFHKSQEAQQVREEIDPTGRLPASPEQAEPGREMRTFRDVIRGILSKIGMKPEEVRDSLCVEAITKHYNNYDKENTQQIDKTINSALLMAKRYNRFLRFMKVSCDLCNGKAYSKPYRSCLTERLADWNMWFNEVLNYCVICIIIGRKSILGYWESLEKFNEAKYEWRKIRHHFLYDKRNLYEA